MTARRNTANLCAQNRRKKPMAYDSNNIFARILRGEIPAKKVFENDHALAFEDIAAKAPVHILLIPKGAYTCAADFAKNATADEITAFHRALADIVEAKNLSATGFRLIANAGINGGQEVPHYHVHILGGKSLGPMLASI
jgi:diadenosine tetraphosphate (Ap4A) HIT family hydrolase